MLLTFGVVQISELQATWYFFHVLVKNALGSTFHVFDVRFCVVPGMLVAFAENKGRIFMPLRYLF